MKAWDSFGGQVWAHSTDCRDTLQDIIKESIGVALPDDGNSTAVYDTFRASKHFHLLAALNTSLLAGRFSLPFVKIRSSFGNRSM